MRDQRQRAGVLLNDEGPPCCDDSLRRGEPEILGKVTGPAPLESAWFRLVPNGAPTRVSAIHANVGSPPSEFAWSRLLCARVARCRHGQVRGQPPLERRLAVRLPLLLQLLHHDALQILQGRILVTIQENRLKLDNFLVIEGHGDFGQLASPRLN